MPDAPILVLVDSSASSVDRGSVAAPGGDRMVLGLSLAQRAQRAARRAGFGRMLLIGKRGTGVPEIAALSGWADLMASLPSGQCSPLAIAPATVLAEVDWLTTLAE